MTSGPQRPNGLEPLRWKSSTHTLTVLSLYIYVRISQTKNKQQETPLPQPSHGVNNQMCNLQFNSSTPLSTRALIFGISQRASGEKNIASIFKTSYVSVTRDPTNIKKMFDKVLDTEI